LTSAFHILTTYPDGRTVSSLDTGGTDLLRELKDDYDSSSLVFIGSVDSTQRIVPTQPFAATFDSVAVKVEVLLKGSLAPGIHWTVDTVGEWEHSYGELKGKRMIWFVRNFEAIRRASTVAPPSPCGQTYYGHPVLDWNLISKPGYLEKTGAGVSLEDFLRTVNAPASLIRDARASGGLNRKRPSGLPKNFLLEFRLDGRARRPTRS
jgi:hypothetical protein